MFSNQSFMNLCPENYDRSHLPQLDSKRIEILWHEGWWDGPLSGVMNYAGEKHWFEIYDTNDDHLGYQYFTIRLTDTEFITAKAEFDKWQKTISWDTPAGKAYYDEMAEKLHPFQEVGRITGWFCERGTTKQQFSAITVVDKNSQVIESHCNQDDPRPTKGENENQKVD
jgi:hypothetical protein